MAIMQVILGERADAAQPGVYVTSKSKQTIQADMVLWCTGVRPASSWLQASAPEVLANKGLIKVCTSVHKSCASQTLRVCIFNAKRHSSVTFYFLSMHSGGCSALIWGCCKVGKMHSA